MTLHLHPLSRLTPDPHTFVLHLAFLHQMNRGVIPKTHYSDSFPLLMARPWLLMG